MTRRERRRFTGYGVLAMTLVGVGCRNGDGSAPIASVTTPGPSTVPPIEHSPGTTALPLGPSAPGTTAVRSDVDPATEQAVKQGVQDFFAAYMACGQAPAQCHPSDFHSDRGTAVGQGTVYFQGLAARGEYFAPDLRGSYIVTQSVALDDSTSAVAFSCWYDASVLLGPLGADGQPTVLNDKQLSVREKQALYFDGTNWKVGEAATVQDLGEGNQCPPADAAPAISTPAG